MKFLPRVCDPSLFSRLPGTQFPVSMIHSGNQNIAISTIVRISSHIIYKIKKGRENSFVCERNVQNFLIHVIRALYIDVSL